MMITKRQFSVTIVIFITLLLLFMGFQIGKEAASTPGINKYVSDIEYKSKSTASEPAFVNPGTTGKPEKLSKENEWIVFVGNENSGYADTVKEWSYYTRNPVSLSKELPLAGSESLPDIIMVEPAFVNEHSKQIADLMEKGVDVIFLDLPDFSYMESDYLLQKMLGIRKVYQEEITLKGMHLFKGFLLGGERVFETDSEEDEDKFQDLDLTVPWYSVRGSTKTFMRGTLSDEDAEEALAKQLKNEDMPAIVWRSYYGKGNAFVVNGNYIRNRMIGMGFLQAMMYERKDYVVYPVINSQVFSVDCLPILTNENQKTVEELYGRSITKAQSDIIIPMFITLSAKYDKKTTCFLSVKYNRSDPEQPSQDLMKTYLPMIDEMNGELALSENHPDSGFNSEELESDFEYLTSEAQKYRISAIMSSFGNLKELSDAVINANDQNIRTVSTSAHNESIPVVGYQNDRITCQQTTSNLTRHTFTDELEHLGVQTLLAYSNCYYNIADAFYPETDEDKWQNSSREIFSNLTTYNKPFEMLDCLTITESDSRIRTYFSLNYKAERNADVITVTTDSDSADGTGYFILRTHDERIDSISGGKFKQIEENAYLISTEREKTEIKLSSSLSALVDMEGSNR